MGALAPQYVAGYPYLHRNGFREPYGDYCEMDIDGSNLAMDFYAVWGHVAQMLPAGLREVPPWLSKNLLLVKARGRLGGEVNFRPEPVPMLVDPVRQLADHIRGRMPGVRAQKADP